MNDANVDNTVFKKRRRRKMAYTALLLFLCLCAGFSGGELSQWLRRSNRPTVTLQLAPVPQTTMLVDADSQPVYHTVVEQVAAQESNSVVEITTESKQTNPFYGSYIVGGAGSGVVLTEDGYIVTNNHVIDGATSIKVRLYTGEEYDAALVGTDVQTDLSVIKIAAQGLKPIVLADSNDIVVGQPVIAIGNPLGTLGGTVTNGIISARDRDIVIGGESMTLLQTTAAINPGNSGGALLNDAGELVGVVNAKSSGESIEGIGFAIPVNTVKSIVPDLITNGYITGRPMLGVGLVDVDTIEKMIYYRLEQPGVYIGSVEGSSSFQQWDRIVAVDGQEVVGSDDVKRLVHQHKAGDSIAVTIIREGREQSLPVLLSEATPSAPDKR